MQRGRSREPSVVSQTEQQTPRLVENGSGVRPYASYNKVTLSACGEILAIAFSR